MECILIPFKFYTETVTEIRIGENEINALNLMFPWLFLFVCLFGAFLLVVFILFVLFLFCLFVLVSFEPVEFSDIWVC